MEPVRFTLRHMKLHFTQSAQRSQRFGLAVACGERKMFSAVSASSNEVGVIVNPTVSEFPKVSFSINPAVFLASGPPRVNITLIDC